MPTVNAAIADFSKRDCELQQNGVRHVGDLPDTRG
jgi:hypothetical protein